MRIRVVVAVVLGVFRVVVSTSITKLHRLLAAGDMVGLEDCASALVAHGAVPLQELATAYELLGIAQYNLGRLKDATNTFRTGVRHFADHKTMWLHLGDCYLSQLKVPQAIAAYETAVIHKRLSDDSSRLYKARSWVALWADRDVLADGLRAQVTDGLSQGMTTSINAADCGDLPPALTLALSRHSGVARMQLPPLPCDTTAAPMPLKLGFVSSDFGLHPVATLVRGLTSMLQRDGHFEVHCFALSDEPSWWRTNITGEVHAMVSLKGLNAVKAAAAIHARGMHILIDLNGHTLHSGLPIMAYRPAPVQVHHDLTTGCNYIDYFLVDAVTSPPTLASTFSEKLIFVPQCYIVNDHKQMMLHAVHAKRPTPVEAKLGVLSASTILFATFSNWQKMDPKAFGAWMHILRRVPDSVMWFMKYPGHDTARLNLIAEAATYGVDGQRRLLFTDMSPWIDHTRVKQVADVVLDTTFKNGHTTLIDALWAGVPVVTLEGDRMSTRAGSSAAHSMHPTLHHIMVVHSFKEYEDVAVAVASAPRTRRSLRKFVQDQRTTSALFDTEGFTAYFAQAMLAAWDLKIRRQGRTPHIITSRDGWQIVDIQTTATSTPDHVTDMQDLRGFANNTVTAIYSSHTLEHSGYGADSGYAVEVVLREWFRVLAPGGALFLSVPDLRTLATLLLRPSITLDESFHVMRMVYGGQVDTHDYHKVGFTYPILRLYLERAGFCSVSHVKSFGLFPDTSDLEYMGVPISLNVVATACKLGRATDVRIPSMQYFD
ncbi:UDP-N-acetylglucosamine-peptide N-acetylglucosaminyltransferase [Achlya hypogyna]|uniref:UDP-N-acetylglucosamine-peptide N-acetylglucosaminyltransferase n=1 Tax=Achlya hypogyna TaxID=1202772 RepID=A0A1V9ZUA8_ACHHY|nr:UDP-N-acetylglucosamine-peptide N-acetylglucosaminyltransferase [Achlya hypogyna]